ncbi:hypothetical protein DPMN_154256 [Dreissena polymorpha]|uniref:Uncharacterized protein n=1 Tax=Dreissena polymorpha TaxID=45954 RepID=A0A9D4FKM8_DREPO|nr:hypothetical protein DPMN_154256 [Dreissena polymorpha]
MALVDAKHDIIWADVSNGSAGDANVLNNSELKETIDKGMFGLPDSEPYENDVVCVIVFLKYLKRFNK